jgi:hypothetical protein
MLDDTAIVEVKRKWGQIAKNGWGETTSRAEGNNMDFLLETKRLLIRPCTDG